MSERVPAQNKTSATPSQATQACSPLLHRPGLTDEHSEPVGSNSNISQELGGIQPKTIRRSLNWQNISVEAPNRGNGMSLPGGIQRQKQEQEGMPAIEPQVSAKKAETNTGELSNLTKATEGPLQPKVDRPRLNRRHISVEAPPLRGEASSQPIQRQQEEQQETPEIQAQLATDSAQKSALESSDSTISASESAQKPLIARAPFNGRDIPVEAPQSSALFSYSGGIQRLETSGVKEQEKSTESVQMQAEQGIQAKSSSGEPQEKEEQPKTIRRSLNWQNISVEAPSRNAGMSLPGGIQRQQEEPPAVIGARVEADSAQKTALESSDLTISASESAQKPLIARAPFNGRNIPVEAPPRSSVSSTYPQGIQRLETSGVKEQEKSTESVQMQPLEEIQSKSSSGEPQEKEEQNKELVQTKLTIGAPGDKYEQEADSMAAKVMTMPDSAIQQPIQRQTGEETEAVQMQPEVNSITPVVQRESGEEEEVQMKSEVQRASDGSSVASGSVENQLAGSKGGGSALPDDVRSFMEPRFGADFSSVRVHTDSNAVQMNKELGAQAFAHGSDIYYGAGKSPGKNELTAHELTHTIQQTGGVQLNKSVLAKPKPEQEQNQPLQAKTLSSSTPEVIQNKPTGTAARIQALVAAAQQMPGHFMGQLSEELLGMNLTEPLPFERSKEDCAKCDTPATAKGGDATAKGGDEKAALLNKTKFAEDDFAIDSVAPFDVDPEFVASLKLQEGGEVEFGESNDPANSMEAIKAELAGGETEGDVPAGALPEGEKAVGGCCDDEQTAEAKLQQMMAQKPEGAEATQKQGKPAQQGEIPANMKTIGPLSVGQRAKYMSHQMIQGVKQWFSANWPKLLAGAIAALAAFVGLNILTGGAITAALPAIMQVFGVVMGGVALANIAGHVGDYLSKGWAGDIAGGAKSLARGLAAGAVELVFALLFNAGALIKALKGGLKGTAKAAKGAVKNTVKTTVKSVKELGQIGAKGAKTAFKNGKIMLGGVKGGFAKGAKSLDDLAKQLVGKLRFNKFKIRLHGRRIQLLGHINPWVSIAEGEVKQVSKKQKGAVFVTDDEFKALQEGGLPQTSGSLKAYEVLEYNKTKASGSGARGEVGDGLTGDHIPSNGSLTKAKENELLNHLTSNPDSNDTLKNLAPNQIEGLKEALTKRGKANAKEVANFIQNANGRKLLAAERQAIMDAVKDINKRKKEIEETAITVVLDEDIHKNLSRTYGGKNTATQIAGDAQDLAGAFKKDAEAILEGLYNDGKLNPEVVGAYARAYQESLRKGVFTQSPEIDQMLMEYVNKVKTP